MRVTRTTKVAGAALTAVAVCALAACSSGPLDNSAPSPSGSAAQSAQSTPSSGSSSGGTGTGTSSAPASSPATSPSATTTPKPIASVTAVPATNAKGVAPDKPIVLSVNQGTWTHLSVTNSSGTAIEGAMNSAHTVWTSSELLTPQSSYKVAGTAMGTDHRSVPYASTFTTLTPSKPLKASIAPLSGSTVGVGFPIVIYWNHDVANKAAVEKKLVVTTSPKVAGSWAWFKDPGTGIDSVHWRPATFWPAGTKVGLQVNTRGVDAGDGAWGVANREISFAIGRSVVSYVDLKAHRMTVKINGKVARTIEVTGGKAGFSTRSGTKVISQKYRHIQMTSCSIGICNPGSSNYYDLGVNYALRVTNTGEFVHAAPWSAGDQGSANVSHGCVGMQTAPARWLYDNSEVGDVVIVTGSNRQLTPETNAITDWTLSWSQYKALSALH